VQRALKIRIDQTYHYTDSMTVLFWLNDDTKRFQAFVNNRLLKIRRTSSPEEWYWVPTLENPADLPSRGTEPGQLGGDSLWQQGPQFLRQEPLVLPPPPALVPTSAVLQEMRKHEHVFLHADAAGEQVLSFVRVSRWMVIIGAVHRILQWRHRAQTRLDKAPARDLRTDAEGAVLRQLQVPLRRALGTDATRNTRSALGLTRLSPFVDERGLLRGAGRLRYVDALPRDSREPILLDRNHPGTRLLAEHCHRFQAMHYGGVNYTLGRLTQRFWIPKGHSLIFKILTDCVPCRKRKPPKVVRPEGALPAFRLPPTTGTPIAFTVTAIDCAGPYRVKRGRSYESHYMLLLTCCQTRAVKLEVLSDLTVDAFIMALTRAASRGTNPQTILSDNGSNFDGANRLLRHLWANMPQAELQTRRPDIKWLFNPPYASHYGGVFERMIRAAKEALYHALPEHMTLSLEQLATAFAQVQGILNARPLSYTTTDGDLTPITPNHFLYGSASLPLFEDLAVLAGSSTTKRWRALQTAMEQFLQRFHREIRPQLQLFRDATRAAAHEVKVGDVVTFFLPSSARKWPIAIVDGVFPGKDGMVRTLRLRISQAADASRHTKQTFLWDIRDVSPLVSSTADLACGAATSTPNPETALPGAKVAD
jgi:hypothetical protein